MTGTTVTSASSLFNNFTVGQNASSGKGSSDFLQVFQKQTASSQSDTQEHKTASTTRKNESLSNGPRTKDSLTVDQEKVTKSDTQEENRQETGKVEDGANLEALMVLLGSGADQFAQQVADELGISIQELDGMLQELGMSHMDLLNQEGLTKLVLAVGGAEDAFAFLTNGELYQQLQNLTAGMEEILKSISQETGIHVEDMASLMEQVKNSHEQQVSEPIITVEREEEPVIGKSQQELSESTQQVSEETKAQTIDKTNSSSKEQSHHKDHNSSKENGTNLFSQNLTQTLEQINAQQVTGAASFTASETESIMKQIMDYMKIQLKPDMSHLEMQLHPESLGTLHIQLTSKQGSVTAQFITQNESVKAALESQMVQLKENFDEQGIKVDAIEVSVQTNEFNRNLDQGNSRGEDSYEKKNHRSRKINLNLPESLDELSVEEQITADIMAVNGNTVDYTA